VELVTELLVDGIEVSDKTSLPIACVVVDFDVVEQVILIKFTLSVHFKDVVLVYVFHSKDGVVDLIYKTATSQDLGEDFVCDTLSLDGGGLATFLR
jgi:hypothetical protein